MAENTLVPIQNIIIPLQRMRVANHIEDLGESIRKNGLLHPVTLRRDGEQLILIAGLRRIRAMEYLHYGEIRAQILDIDEIQALLIEIDENLQRAELTELQRAQHIMERKRIWEGLYPQTKVGGAPGAGRGKKPRHETHASQEAQNELLVKIGTEEASPAPKSFVEETAERQQRSKATVKRSVKIGTGIKRKAQELVAGTTIEDKQVELLRLAKIKDETTQVEVAMLIHEGKASNVVRAQRMIEGAKLDAAPPPLPTGPFDVLVVDPPWAFTKRPHDGTKRENVTYATMTIKEIQALPISVLAAPDALLWLWTTNAHLPEAFAIVTQWGFTYKTLLTWDKVRIGMGDWLRGQTEHCLFCARGTAKVLLTDETTLLRETSTRHSQKPERFYTLVESLCPGSKVELFARQARPGWQCWGAEATDCGDPSASEVLSSQGTLAFTGD